jgi:hypothetical protein
MLCLSFIRRWLTIGSTKASSGTISPHSIESLEKEIAFDACRVLSASRIPSYMWGEHALACYGVPTFLFDVFLLVDDPEAAAQVLLAWGLVRTKPNPRFNRISEIQQAPRLAVPTSCLENAGNIARQSKKEELPDAEDEDHPGWILLRADDWPDNMLVFASRSYIPPLSIYLNCLISTYMETFDIERRCRIACHITYFYSYIEEVKTDDFSKKISLENRQFHFDRLTSDHDRHHIIFEKVLIANRDIRQRIRRREYKPSMNGISTSTITTRGLSRIDETNE